MAGASADATAVYAIELEDGTSGAAAQAAGALEKLRGQIDGDTKALRQMEAAMKNLQRGTVVNVQVARDLKNKIDAKKAAIVQAQEAYISLGGALTKNTKATATQANRLQALQRIATGVNPALGAMVGRLVALQQGAASVSIGLVAVVGGLGLLVAATGVAIAALARYGFAQADAARSEELRLQGLVALKQGIDKAEAGGALLQSSIDQVAASSALGRDKVAKYGEELYRMGLRGQSLEAALDGVAIKAVVFGEKQATAFGRGAAAAAAAGKSVTALAARVRDQLGSVAESHMLSLTVQAEKQREAFAALFTGLRVEPALKGLFNVRNLLSQNTATGRALKVLLTTMLQPLIDGFAAALPYVRRFFQGVTIMGLKLTLGFLMIRNAIKRTFGKGVLGDIDLATAALYAGQAAVLVFVGGLLAVAAPALLAATAVWAVINTARLLYQLWKETPWTDLGKALFNGLIDWNVRLLRAIVDLDRQIIAAAIGLGMSITDGLRQGIANSAQWVVDAMKGLGAKAWGAFKEALGIASPSRVMMRLGLTIPQGAALGIDRGAPAVDAAGADLAVRARTGFAAEASQDVTGGAPRLPIATPAPAAGGDTARAPQPGASSSGPAVQIGELHVHAQTSEPEDLALAVGRKLEELLAGVAVQVGAPTPEPA